MIDYDKILELADSFAELSHRLQGQTRKYSADPYIVHPRRVSAILAANGHHNSILSAALLHDVVEDVSPKNLSQAALNLGVSSTHIIEECLVEEPLDYRDARRSALLILETMFPRLVVCLVEEVTDISQLSDGNRKLRKNMDLEHYRLASFGGRSIKLADILDNGPDIILNDPGFARKWMSEARVKVDISEGGDPDLLSKAQMLMKNYFRI
jgi:hypothetical protein